MRMPRKGRKATRSMTAALSVMALGVGVLGALGLSSQADASSPAAQAKPAAVKPASNTTGAAATSGGLKVAYYDQWSIYQNAFYLKNVNTEGMAEQARLPDLRLREHRPDQPDLLRGHQGDRPRPGWRERPERR